jgi:transcriptional regulator MraZ
LSFTGEFRHTIDAKGRLIVPARMRDEIVDDSVVLVMSPEGCIDLYSGDRWAEYESQLLAQRKANPDSRTVIRRIASSAHPDRIDRQGRMTIPPHLRAHAGIEREVLVVGSFDHAEIWSPERWADDQPSDDELKHVYRGMNL